MADCCAPSLIAERHGLLQFLPCRPAVNGSLRTPDPFLDILPAPPSRDRRTRVQDNDVPPRALGPLQDLPDDPGIGGRIAPREVRERCSGNAESLRADKGAS